MDEDWTELKKTQREDINENYYYVEREDYGKAWARLRQLPHYDRNGKEGW